MPCRPPARTTTRPGALLTAAALWACSGMWFPFSASALAGGRDPEAGEQNPPTDPRIDAATGRDLRVWPPDRVFDHLRMRLEIDIPTMEQPGFSAMQTLTVTPIGAPRDSITLDASPHLHIRSVRSGEQDLVFTHLGDRLTIRFPEIRPGEAVTLRIAYDTENPGGHGAGLTWSPDDEETPEFDPMLHSQGEAEASHLWFPCHDFPNERLATEIVVTVPAGYEALSNGRLVSRTESDGGERTTFHWAQEKPHVYYLVSLVVGKFDIVEVGGDETARPGLWMPVYAPLGAGEHVRETFARTPEMVAYFEELFDEPFPWDKYAQSFARDFAAGAMENTSASTFHWDSARMSRETIEPTIAHELAHQWFGNLVTCKSWQHLWLNEGFATFAEALWAEREGGRDAYRRVIFRNLIATRAESRGSHPHRLGMLSNRYTNPDDRFMEPDNVYSRGGVFLHILRERLGDEVFWEGVRLYLDRHTFKEAETEDFRRVMEEVSGESLERFFDQWARRPGLPRLMVDYAWDESAKRLTVKLEQTQQIDGDNPAYAFTLPLYVEYAGSTSGDQLADRGEWFSLSMDSSVAEATFDLESRPERIRIDPRITILAFPRVRTPLPEEPPAEPAPPVEKPAGAAEEAAPIGAE